MNQIVNVRDLRMSVDVRIHILHMFTSYFTIIGHVHICLRSQS